MASPDNTDAADLQVWLSHILGLFVEVHDLGKIYLSRVAYKIGPKRGPEPDIGFVPKAMEHRRRRNFIDAPPALAMGIRKPGQRRSRLTQSLAIYEAAGVAEFWIIDPDDERATFLRLRNGRFREVSLEGHLFHQRGVAGVLARRALVRGIPVAGIRCAAAVARSFNAFLPRRAAFSRPQNCSLRNVLRRGKEAGSDVDRELFQQPGGRDLPADVFVEHGVSAADKPVDDHHLSLAVS